MPRRSKPKYSRWEKLSMQVTNWMGTTQAIVVHTLIFIGAGILVLLGIDANAVMLSLTTAVSLEAIYLALFIQMTVNRHSKSLSEVEKDIDEIQEDVEEVTEDMVEDETKDEQALVTLSTIEKQVRALSEDLKGLGLVIKQIRKDGTSQQSQSTNNNDDSPDFFLPL